MKHGTHDGLDLTPEGLEQVSRSARAHLKGVEITHCFSSGLPRTTQTPEQALLALGVEALPEGVEVEPYFGLDYYEQETSDRWPYEDLVAIIAEAGDFVTLAAILEKYPPYNIARHVLRCTMQSIAERIVTDYEAYYEEVPADDICEWDVLVGAHGTAVAAALDPETMTGNLGLADIVRYGWQMFPGRRAVLESSEHLPAPKALVV